MQLINMTDIRQDGSYNAPASAMTPGLAVKISSATIALAGAGDRPYGFLRTDVTTDGLSWLELQSIPAAEVFETKVSVGKVLVVLWEEGEIATDNDGGETWAVDEKIAVTAAGVLTNSPATNDWYIGKVKKINQTIGGTTGMNVITLSHDLGLAA